jgi:hypothetical protein
LYIDRKVIIDNDGGHPPLGCAAVVELASGIHDIRVSYFQGPRYYVALMLLVAPPGASWRVFDTADFTPPPDSPLWKFQAAQPVSGKKRVGRVKGGKCWAQ